MIKSISDNNDNTAKMIAPDQLQWSLLRLINSQRSWGGWLDPHYVILAERLQTGTKWAACHTCSS